MSRLPATKLAAFLALTLLSSVACGQGLLIVTNATERVRLPRPLIRPEPVPPMSYKIKELSVQARLVDQVARVQVTQSFVNTGSRPMEVSFIFPLPYDGAIEQMTFMIDGREYPAKLLPASEARQIYEGYVRRNHDPALLEWIGTGMFQTSVFPVPPGAERKVSLRYSQLLRKVGLADRFPVPAQHRQVHVRTGREDRDSKRRSKARSKSRTSTVPRIRSTSSGPTQRGRSSPTSARTKSR